MKLLVLLLSLVYVSALEDVPGFKFIGEGHCVNTSNEGFDSCYYGENKKDESLDATAEKCGEACLATNNCIGFQIQDRKKCRMFFGSEQGPPSASDEDDFCIDINYGYGDGEISKTVNSRFGGYCYAIEQEPEKVCDKQCPFAYVELTSANKLSTEAKGCTNQISFDYCWLCKNLKDTAWKNTMYAAQLGDADECSYPETTVEPLMDVSGYTKIGDDSCVDGSGNRYDYCIAAREVDGSNANDATGEECASWCDSMDDCLGFSMGWTKAHEGRCNLIFDDGKVPSGMSDQCNYEYTQHSGTGEIVGSDVFKWSFQNGCWKKNPVEPTVTAPEGYTLIGDGKCMDGASDVPRCKATTEFGSKEVGAELTADDCVKACNEMINCIGIARPKGDKGECTLYFPTGYDLLPYPDYEDADHCQDDTIDYMTYGGGEAITSADGDSTQECYTKDALDINENYEKMSGDGKCVDADGNKFDHCSATHAKGFSDDRYVHSKEQCARACDETHNCKGFYYPDIEIFETNSLYCHLIFDNGELPKYRLDDWCSDYEYDEEGTGEIYSSNNGSGYGCWKRKEKVVVEKYKDLNCNPASWTDIDINDDGKEVICGPCSGLADNMDSVYKTCEAFCQAQGLPCVRAHEEDNDDCTIKNTYTCDFDFTTLRPSTSDAICECGTPTDVEDTSGFTLLGRGFCADANENPIDRCWVSAWGRERPSQHHSKSVCMQLCREASNCVGIVWNKDEHTCGLNFQDDNMPQRADDNKCSDYYEDFWPSSSGPIRTLDRDDSHECWVRDGQLEDNYEVVAPGVDCGDGLEISTSSECQSAFDELYPEVIDNALRQTTKKNGGPNGCWLRKRCRRPDAAKWCHPQWTVGSKHDTRSFARKICKKAN